MAAVKADTHCFYFARWPDGVGRPADSSTDLAVGAASFPNLAGLAVQVIGWSFLVSALGSAEDTVFLPMGGASIGLGQVSSVLAMADEVVESTGGVPLFLILALDWCLGNGGMVSSTP